MLENFPQNPETDKLREIVNKALDDEIEKVLQGNISWVERQYKHYVDNSPSDDSKNILEESVVEKCYGSTASIDFVEEKNNQESDDNLFHDRDHEQQDIQYEEKIIDNNKRRRRKVIEYND